MPELLDGPMAVAEQQRPQPEPVEFGAAARGAPAELDALVLGIRKVASQFLYHWRTFPIALPPSLAPEDRSKKTAQYHLRDCFVAPNFDELDSVAVDVKGEPRRLNGKQLECIRERG